MPPTKHATLGASSSERWMACPGSIRLSEGMPNSSSSYAPEGTAAHALAERALRKGLDPDVWLDTEIEEVLVTEEMCGAVRVFVDFVRREAAGEKELMLEQRFDLSPLSPPAPMFGTSDAVIWNPKSRLLHVIDYKHGQGVAVAAIENTQLRYYALGAVIALQKQPRRIRMTIVQPRAAHADGIIRSDEIGFKELVLFKQSLFAAAVRTQDPDAPLVTGDHCRFCPALAVCPAQKAKAVEIAQSEFDVLPIDGPPLPAQLTPEQLGKVLEVAPMIEDWIKAVRNHVSGIIDSGAQVEGWKLVPKRANRKWADEEYATGYLEEALGGDAYTQKLISPAQAEKALKKIGSKLDDSLVVKESSGTNLVPDTDPRPALAPSATEEFTTTVDS